MPKIIRIAVTSQNRHTITPHAGKCRFFWVYDSDAQHIIAKHALEISREQSLSSGTVAAPLMTIDVLICGGIGTGLATRLHQHGILPLLTSETDPDLAVTYWLEGRLRNTPAIAQKNACQHFAQR